MSGRRRLGAAGRVALTAAEVLALGVVALSAISYAAGSRRLALTLLLAGVGVTAAGALVSALAARASLAPLRRAAETARQVTESSLGERVDYDGPDDEVGQMVTALNGMLARLEEAFEEQRRFIADAAHELRTPLAIVKGNLELTQLPQVSEEDRAEARSIMAEEIDRMSRLMTDLLSLARLESELAHPALPLELRSLTAEAVARARALSMTAEVRHECGGEVWVRSDTDRLMQAILNLLRNALAHVPAEGGLIVIACLLSGDRGIVEVRNNGPRIREDSLPHIFERFYRVAGERTADGGGSGLGLAITRRLVEIDGGRVAAENRPDGVAFTIELPRVGPPGERP